MKINKVDINLIVPKAGLIGFASLVLNDTLFFSGIAIHEKLDQSGYRLTYPTRKSGDQIFTIYHPINSQASKSIESAIFRKLKDVLNESCMDVGYSGD